MLPFGVFQYFFVTTMAVWASFYSCHYLSPANWRAAVEGGMSSARRRGSGSPRGHIEVDLGERSYSICIGEDTLAQAGPEIARCTMPP